MLNRSLLLLLFVCNIVWAQSTVVMVEAQGSSFEDAKRNGFRQAIEQVVGLVLVNETEVKNGQLNREYMASYSSGYIDDFEVIQSYQESNGQFTVKMNVLVASSKLAQRMLVSPNADAVINGERLQAQLESQLEERDQGDEIIANILASYPERAYVVNQGQSELRISRSRQPYIDIPYTIVMSKYWVAALDEALGLVAVKSTNCNTLTMAVADSVRYNSRGVKQTFGKLCGNEPDIRVFVKSGLIPRANSYYFADNQTLEMINEHLQSPGQPHIGLRVDMLAADGSIIDTRCANINNELFVNYAEPQGTYNYNNRYRLARPHIMGQNNVYGTLRVQMRDPRQFANIVKIKLNVEKSCSL